MLRIESKLAVWYAAIAGAIPATYLFFAFLGQPAATIIGAVLKSVLVFLGCFIFINIAYFAGGRWSQDGIAVSPWFVLLAAGAFFLFWLGYLSYPPWYVGGLGAVVLWSLSVLLLLLLTRIFQRLRA